MIHSMLAGALIFAVTVNFDTEKAGSLPAGWLCGVTGQGSPQWQIHSDPAAPKSKILKQSGHGTFPWCVKKDVQLADGNISVKFKPLSGQEDQAGGIVWRWKNGDNYYIARANALENNVALYYTEGGSRKKIKYVDAPVAAKVWHTLKITFKGKHIAVALDGKTYIEVDDEHISGGGAVGVWTKADSVTEFDDFSYEGK